MAQRAETTVTGCSLTNYVWARFLTGPTRCLDSGIVSPLRLHCVKGVCVFRCNLPPALLAEWPGSNMCHCGDTGMEWTPNKSQHTKLTLEKKILPPLLPGFELATFRSRVRRSNQQAIAAPHVTRVVTHYYTTQIFLFCFCCGDNLGEDYISVYCHWRLQYTTGQTTVNKKSR